ncbi:nuclear transport factor 2 family protein [Leisingera daeponensis]|uniref:Nuclear transport factor 2 family protein n=1 Tax=Leisingera daeponensis TaxID=405746 RepID=A0ABS7NJ36_9RHOB|nr:nuclear transport factor 2 family protein [Leisingera daeponensis]MBY6141220.1 nuclear transport factor 2 family protein [Leisingera daeponensis]
MTLAIDPNLPFSTAGELLQLCRIRLQHRASRGKVSDRMQTPAGATTAANSEGNSEMTRNELCKAVVLDYVDAMNAGDWKRLLAQFASDARIQGVTGSGGLDFALPIWKQLHDGLNMHLDVQEIIADGNHVAVRYCEQGCWTAPFLGFTEPTGWTYELVAIEWFEISNGKIASRWGHGTGLRKRVSSAFQPPRLPPPE